MFNNLNMASVCTGYVLHGPPNFHNEETMLRKSCAPHGPRTRVNECAVHPSIHMGVFVSLFILLNIYSIGSVYPLLMAMESMSHCGWKFISAPYS